MISQEPGGEDMIQSLVDEVLDLVENYSDLTDVWTLYNGVEAWDVLYGYTQDVRLLDWLKSLSDEQHHHVYEDFLRRWTFLYPRPVYKVVR